MVTNVKQVRRRHASAAALVIALVLLCAAGVGYAIRVATAPGVALQTADGLHTNAPPSLPDAACIWVVGKRGC